MKNLYFLTVVVFSFLSYQSHFAQCGFSNTQFGMGVAPTSAGSTVIITSCNYYGEYSPVSGFLTSNIYTLDILDGGYITVFDGSLTPVSFGPAPLDFVPPADGNYNIQWNGLGCTSDVNCHETSVTNIGPSGPCSNPANGGTVISSVQVACSGSPFSLSLSGASTGSGLTYQWQSSLDGITYTDIPGAVNSTCSASQTASTYYQCVVTCSAGTPVMSPPLLVNMGSCVTMADGSATTCGGNFYDSGGSAGNYLDNEFYTFTITPSTPGAFLQIVFNSFDLETCCDGLTVYDGNSTAAPFMGSFATNPGAITSSAPDGSLTFVFSSDGSVTYTGWEAVIGCLTTPPANDLVCAPEIIPVDGSVNNYTNALATVETGESAIVPPTTGFYTTDGWGSSGLQRTVWFTFDAPASGNVRISCTDIEMDGQVAIYEVGNCNDFSTFNLVAANDNDLDFMSEAPKFTVCGLTPGQTYYLMYDSGNNFASGPFSISIEELNISAGVSSGVVDVCNGATVDLFDGISGNDTGGIWEETIPTFGLNGSVWNTSGVAYQVFDFLYIVEDGCLIDTSVSQIHVFGPSNAGNDGTINACKGEMINLLSGLSGNVDLGGTWYNPNNQAVNGNVITTSTIPGEFNYDYVASNGVCPSDTSNVLVIVADCVAGIEDGSLAEIAVFPNPSNGTLYLAGLVNNNIPIMVKDLNGRSVNFKMSSEGEYVRMEIDNSARGMYLLQFELNDRIIVRKIVIE
jgi:hypothetical protein